MGVRTKPGSTTVTGTPRGRSSMSIDSSRKVSPALLAPYGAPRGMVFASLNLESFQKVSAELAGTHHAGGPDQVVLVIDPTASSAIAKAHCSS